MRGRVGRARAPGTCGELVQGALDGVDFLVTCPVDLYSTVEVRLINGSGSWDCPPGYEKTLRAVQETSRRLGHPRAGGFIRVESPLPRGKGMASSTADVAAACLATARALGEWLDPHTIADIALGIEPTDGLMYRGIALFDHRRGLLRQPLGMPPPLEILVVDAGGEVDTKGFNQRPDLDRLNQDKEPAVREALALVAEGIRKGDPSLVGRGATLSARSHQTILGKPGLEEFIALAREAGAVGVNVAHSGTVLGLLFDARDNRLREAETVLRRQFNGWPVLSCRVVGGGVQ